MTKPSSERRRHPRYETELEVRYYFIYEVKTLVQFQIKDQQSGQVLSRKYSGLSKNVSAEGLCFTSGKQLEKGNLLHLEVYVPGSKEPVHMEGEVAWSKATSLEEQEENKSVTGVKILTVQRKPVRDSIFFDETHQLYWSGVLESVFGGFREVAPQFRSV